MTLEQKKQELRNRLNKHCPELLELTEGCLFRDPEAIDWAQILKLIVYTKKGKLYFKETQNGSVFHVGSRHLDKLEIIGHPPQLNHVLFAIAESNKFNSEWETLAKIHRKMFIPTYNQGVYQNEQLYNFTLLPLDQDEPTIDFFLSTIE